MWNKIYVGVLAFFVLIMAFLTYYSASWLGSIGSPRAALEGYDYYANLSGLFLWLSSAILLLLANVLLWMKRQAWAMWATLLYFAIFIGIRAFWLDPSAFALGSANNLPSNVSIFGPFLTFLAIGAALAIVYFNQLVLIRMNKNLYPPIEPAIGGEVDLPEEEFGEEDEKEPDSL